MRANQLLILSLLTAVLSVRGSAHAQESSLIEAAAAGELEAVRAMLDEGADVDERDELGRTALIAAAAEGRLEILDLLLARNADPTKSSKDGASPLLAAAERAQNTVIERLLTSLPSDAIEEENDRGSTALLLAAEKGHDATVALLLERGAALDARNDHGETALVLAAANGHDEVVARLLEAGADIEAYDNHRATALLRAAAGGHGHVVRRLILAGADPDARLRRLGPAVELARRLGHGQVVAVLESDVAKTVTGATIDAGTGRDTTTLPESTGPGRWSYIPGVEYGPDAYDPEDVAPPELLRQVPAAYTEDALVRNVEGQVGMEVVVLKDGRVGPLRITQSLDLGLDINAIQAVRQWEFRPGRLRGEPVHVVVDVAVDFAVQGGLRMKLLRGR